MNAGCIASAILNSTSDALVVDLPRDGQQYHLIVRLSGTFVGTAALASSTDNGATFTTRTTTTVSGTTQANPTGVGVYAIDCTSGADYAKVSLSAYTSGNARAECWLVPVSA